MHPAGEIPAFGLTFRNNRAECGRHFVILQLTFKLLKRSLKQRSSVRYNKVR
jgi:hypothetical protein